MKLSSPLPQPLPKECVKAARICMFYSRRLTWTSLMSFVVNSFVDQGNNGLDGVSESLPVLESILM